MTAVQSDTSLRQYETIYILRSDAAAAASEKVAQRVRDVIGRSDGVLTKVESWGRRKLAYPVRKQSRGVYFYVAYGGSGSVVRELERSLRLDDQVLKFQTVKIADSFESSAAQPEDLQFEYTEAVEDEDEELSRAQSLGLADTRDRGYSSSSDDDRNDRGDRDNRGDQDRDAAPTEATAGTAAASPAEAAEAPSGEAKKQDD